MTEHHPQPTLVIEADGRRELLHRLVECLRERLGADAAWDHDATVTPWQVTAPSFPELPARMIAAVLDAADATGERLVDLEMGGFLETDSGPRAWGMVATREGAPGETLRVDDVAVSEHVGGWRLEATLWIEGGTDG